MAESILNSIKEMRMIQSEDHFFDSSLIVTINTALNTLTQLGVGPKTGFQITGENDLWSDFIQDDVNLNMIKTFVDTYVHIYFDPPTSSFVLSAYQEQLKELTYRINLQVDHIYPED